MEATTRSSQGISSQGIYSLATGTKPTKSGLFYFQDLRQFYRTYA